MTDAYFICNFRTVNAGKSEWNEDQACVWQNVLVRDSERHIPGAGLPYTYFSLFDGHAGHGAAVAAANQLHEIVHVSNHSPMIT